MTNEQMMIYYQGKRFYQVSHYKEGILTRYFQNGEVWDYDSKADYWNLLS